MGIAFAGTDLTPHRSELLIQTRTNLSPQRYRYGLQSGYSSSLVFGVVELPEVGRGGLYDRFLLFLSLSIRR